MSSLRIALAGNPNCGKTTMFNSLTGSNQYVGNWPGVTVEKKEGRYRHDKNVTIQDLPGIYSLSPYTLEEVVARNYLIDERPDAIINLVDASNLERNLYLSMQLLELNIPMVIALNMIDVVRKTGDRINIKELSEAIGCPVIETSSLKNEGLNDVMNAAICAAKNHTMVNPIRFCDTIETALNRIGEFIRGKTELSLLRFYAIKLFEHDEEAYKKLSLAKDEKQSIEEIINTVEFTLNDDSESLITSDRYAYIARNASKLIKKKSRIATTSDKIDSIVTNRILALPIFIAVMFLVYYISISTVGGYLTDWTNDGLFGDGFTLLGIEFPGIPSLIESGLTAIGCADWLQGLILDGIVGGVGAVLGFVPQMLVLFLLLAFLEDCGYMSRIAFIMDRLFRRLGLSGKSFIPMLIGTGCSVPGIMASRTIEQDRDRKMTIITTSFIPCGAKMPIVALIAGAIFGGAWWVAPCAYFIGVAAVVISGVILKKTKLFAGDPAPFVMELPSYHIPTISGLLRSMWERGWSFIKKAGTIILLSSIVVWFFKSFGITPDGLIMVEDMDQSILAVIGSFIAPLFSPLGFGTWQQSVATVLGLVAKEEVVGVFGVLYGVAGDALELVEESNFGAMSAIAMHFTSLSAFSFLVFNLLCAPCFAAIGAIKREMNNARWTWFAIAYQTIFAYAMSLIVYQTGLLILHGSFGIGTVIAFILLAGLIYLLLRKPSRVTALSVSINS